MTKVESYLTEEQALRTATHRHYKGGLYRFVAEAEHSETNERMVVYLHVWPHVQKLWIRPAELFFGKLEDGTSRFYALTQPPADIDSGGPEHE